MNKKSTEIFVGLFVILGLLALLFLALKAANLASFARWRRHLHAAGPL